MNPINPHVWRRFKRAEKNMMRFIRVMCASSRDRRRARKWAKEFRRWNQKLL